MYQRLCNLATVEGLAAAGILLAVASSPFAFEEYPEFRGVTAKESDGFDDPVHIDGEYTSDYVTYQKPLDWEYDWLINKQGLDASLGSLAPKRFLYATRLKIDQALFWALRFRFIYLTERDLLQDETHYVWELICAPHPRWAASVWVDPSLFKKEDAVGLSFTWNFSPFHELRTFAHLLELDNARRDEGPYTPDGQPLPASLGLVGRAHSDPDSGRREFIEYALRFEPEAERLSKSDMFRHNYWKLFGSLFFQKQIGQSSHVAARAQYDQKYERLRPYREESEVVDEEWTRSRFMSQIECRVPASRTELRPALAYFLHQWDTPAGDIVLRDIVPQLWFSFPEIGEGTLRQRWRCGYEMTYRFASDDSEILGKPIDDTRDDHRLNVRWDLAFRDYGLISLLFTFDGDMFMTGETWEGGNAQVKFLF